MSVISKFSAIFIASRKFETLPTFLSILTSITVKGSMCRSLSCLVQLFLAYGKRTALMFLFWSVLVLYGAVQFVFVEAELLPVLA